MKKVKNTEPSNTEDQFEDFNQDDFADLDELAGEESAESETLQGSDDLSTEYHGADPDLPAQEQIAPVATKRNLIAMLKENWLYVGIGLIVIIVAIYLLMDVFSSGSTAPQQQAAQTQQTAGFNNVPAQSSDSTQQSSDQQAVVANPQPVPTNPMTDAQMQKLLESLTQVVQQNAEDLQKTITTSMQGGSNTQLSQVAAALNTLSANVDKMNQTLANVEQQLVNTQGQLQNVIAQQTVGNQNLTLRAVVPGRAWLVDGSGHTTTVTVGTPLGAIGTVTSVDPSSNTVTTSTGYVFK